MIGFVIKNEVVKGSGLGLKDLGFATAKVDFFTDEKIVLGCYRSKIAINGELYLGITNISFNNYYISETHIINFNEDIYGIEVEITLLDILRNPILAKTIKESKSIIQNDIKLFWDSNWNSKYTCNSCKFCVAQDYGYSNYTVEGTDYSCLVENYKPFVRRYGNQSAPVCPNFNEGERWYLDVDGYEEKPTEEWFKAEYRNIILEKLIN